MEDRNGNIWFGYNGLGYYDGNKVIHFKEQEAIKNIRWICIEEDSKGNIWLYVRDRGVQHFDGKVFKYFGKEQGFKYPFPIDAHQDKQGRIWINNYSPRGEVMSFRYNPETEEITHFAREIYPKLLL